MPTIGFITKFRNEFEDHLEGRPCPYEKRAPKIGFQWKHTEEESRMTEQSAPAVSTTGDKEI